MAIKNRKSSSQERNQRNLLRKTSSQERNQRKALLDLAAARLVKRLERIGCWQSREWIVNKFDFKFPLHLPPTLSNQYLRVHRTLNKLIM